MKREHRHKRKEKNNGRRIISVFGTKEDCSFTVQYLMENQDFEEFQEELIEILSFIWNPLLSDYESPNNELRNKIEKEVEKIKDCDEGLKYFDKKALEYGIQYNIITQGLYDVEHLILDYKYRGDNRDYYFVSYEFFIEDIIYQRNYSYRNNHQELFSDLANFKDQDEYFKTEYNNAKDIDDRSEVSVDFFDGTYHSPFVNIRKC